MTAGPHPVRLFLTARRARTALSATIVVGALTAWLGLIEAPLPMAIEQGRPTVPLWRLLAMGAAVLPVLALTSPLADLEALATWRLRVMQRWYLAGLAAGSAVGYLGISALGLRPSVIGIIARSWMAWFGLALLAGVILGWRLAWTLPATVTVILFYWGHRDDGYRWWEFSARPYDDLPSLLLSAALLAVGVTAYGATPWRRHRTLSPLQRCRGHRTSRKT